MAESQGNLRASRLYEMTDDAAVRRMPSFNLARDIMHRYQLQAALDELGSDWLNTFSVPAALPLDRVMMSRARTFRNLSAGTERERGTWRKGPATRTSPVRSVAAYSTERVSQRLERRRGVDQLPPIPLKLATFPVAWQ